MQGAAFFSLPLSESQRSKAYTLRLQFGVFSNGFGCEELRTEEQWFRIYWLWKGHLRLPIPLPCILQLMVPALEPLQHPHPDPLLLRWWIKVINKELQHCLVGLYFLFGSSSCRHCGMNRLILNWTC